MHAHARRCTRARTGVLTINELQKLLRRGTTVELDAALQPGAAGEIELKVDQNIALRKDGVDKGAANLLQGLDIDESLGLDQVDEQIRDFLSKRAVRVVELFRQWDDDGTGKIEKKEFRRGMKELGLTVSTKQLDELFDMWDPDKSGAASHRLRLSLRPCRMATHAHAPAPAHRCADD